MSGFGDIFAGALLGGSSSPYEMRGYRAEEDRIKSSRLAVANAFNEWRAANPEATQQELAQFLNSATGGDPMSAGTAYSGRAFAENFDKKSAEAKAKRVIEEGNKQAAENSAWGERITAIYQKNLAASAYDPEIAWQKTQAEVSGLAPDPDTKNVFTKRLDGFDYKGFAKSDTDEWVTKNSPKIQEVIFNGLRSGADEKTIHGQLTAQGLGRNFLDNPLVGSLFSNAKVALKEESEAKARQQKEIEYTEKQREEARQENDRKTATQIAELLNGGSSVNDLKSIFKEDFERLAPQINALRSASWDVKASAIKDKKPELIAEATKTQLAQFDIATIAKSNPTAGMALREFASQYALTPDQRSKVIGVATDPKMTGKNYAFITQKMTEALSSSGPVTTIDSIVQAKIDSQTKRGPAKASQKLQSLNEVVQKDIATNQSDLTKAISEKREDVRMGMLRHVIAAATEDLQKVTENYTATNFESDFIGDSIDDAEVTRAAKLHIDQLQQVITKATAQLKEDEKPRAPPTPRVSRTLTPAEISQRDNGGRAPRVNGTLSF